MVMDNLNDALDCYFSCGRDMASGKAYILEYLSQSACSVNCIENIMGYLSDMQKIASDINSIVMKVNDTLADFECCIKIPCECSGRLKLKGLLLDV